ncbi:MAG TPA: 4Fe-4S binding protein, partial [Calditrichia bacterium]|nr:4Fe-4S binding protein [Calditrichia bacterium]
LTLIARRVTELSLIPGIVAHDTRQSGLSLQRVRMPEPELIRRYIGSPDEEIDPPTEAQKKVFGEKRARVPHLMDPALPLGIGVVHQQHRLRSVAAENFYWQAHLPGIIQKAMVEFGELTGREYAQLSHHNAEKADYVVITQGALVNDLLDFAAAVTDNSKLRLGVVNLTSLQPFPDAMVAGLLKGKKGVTVLERTSLPLAEDGRLTARIRAALNKAVRNGSAPKDKIPYPELPVYSRPADLPALFSGRFGSVDHHREVAALMGVLENMLPDGEQRPAFYLGVDLLPAQSRYPILEAVRQQLLGNYPELARSAINTKRHQIPAGDLSGRISLLSLFAQSLGDLGTLLAKSLFRGGAQQVIAEPESETISFAQPAAYTIAYSPNNRRPALLGTVQAVICTEASLLKDLSDLREEGLLLLHSELEATGLWRSLSQEVRDQIRRRNIRVKYLNAVALAAQTATIPAFQDFYTLLGMAGAFFRDEETASNLAVEKQDHHFLQILSEDYHHEKTILSEMATLLEQGGQRVKVLNWRNEPPYEDLTPPEKEAPWTLQGLSKSKRPLYDGAGFWDSVGYLHQNNDGDLTLADPLLATHTMPGSTSAFKDMTPHRQNIPQLIGENCTACGICWSLCPDSALPATVQDFNTAIETAIERCTDAGQSILQLKRVSGHLAKQANKLFSSDDLHQFPTLGGLLREAFDQLLPRLNAKPDQEKTLRSEFEFLHEQVSHFPIIRTARFWEIPRKTDKESGLFFTITVNPLSCKGCKSCVEACPENALESVVQTDDIVLNYRQNWRFRMSLPDISGDKLSQYVSEEDPRAALYPLMNKAAYHTTPGGDSAFPGSGAKTAVHLLTSAVETLMEPRLAAFSARIDEMIEKLESAIQETLTGAVKINDFEAFGRQLNQLGGQDLGSSDLGKLLEDGSKGKSVQTEKLKTLNDSLTELKTLKNRFSRAYTGNRRANMVLMLGGELLAWSAVYPYNAFPYPWLNQPSTDLASAAAGLFEGITAQMAGAFAAIRLADLKLRNSYETGRSEQQVGTIGWGDFTPEEKDLCPPVLLLCDEAAFREQALAGLSRIMGGDLPVKIAVINTGDGVDATRPEPGIWGLSFPKAFVLQSSPGNPVHLVRGIRKGMAMHRPALFHLDAAEPQQHGLASYQAYPQEVLAVETRVFPLFYSDPQIPGTLADRLNLDGNPQPKKDWLPQNLRGGSQPSAHLSPAHWAVHEGRYRKHFTRIPASTADQDMIFLDDYLRAEAAERAGKRVFIEFLTPSGKAMRALLSVEMVRFCEERLMHWRMLQELAGYRLPNQSLLEKEWNQRLQNELTRLRETLTQSHRQELAEMDQSHRETYHQRLTEKLLHLSKIGQDSEWAQRTLREYLRNGDEEDNRS